VFATGSVLGVAFAVLGIYASASGGVPSRLANPELGSREARLLASVRTHPLGQKCRSASDIASRAELCAVYMPQDPKLRILVLGDSHSYAILPAFAEIGKENAVYHLGLAACPPINRASIQRGAFDAGVCEDVARRQVETVKEGHFDVVVLVARWSLYPGGDDAGRARYFALAPEGDPYFPSLAVSRETFASRVPATVKDYLDLGVAVVVIEQVPEQQVLPQKILQQVALLGIGSGLTEQQFEEAIFETSTPIEANEKLQAFSEGVLEKLRGDRVWVLSFDDVFKRDGRYIWGDRNGSYYMDRDHISAYGATFLAPAMTAAFADIEDSLRSQQAAGAAPKSRL
jgi:hypothetical protein